MADLSGCVEGPEVYRLARAYSVDTLIPLAELALGSRIARVERDSLGGSHAVYFAALENGEECVIRVATHPEHDMALELWVTERIRSLGLPVPETLAYDLAPKDGCAPYMVSRRMPGLPAHGQPLTPEGRRVVFEQLGRAAAVIHSVALPGFGKLLPAAEGVAGSSNSLAEYVIGDVESCLERLPDEILSPERKNAIRERFAGAHAALDRSAGVLVHGDFRFKNILMDGLRVSAILDFEMAISGEPAMDLAWLLYSDGKDAQDLEAILKGYRDEGGPDLNPGMRKRLLLYELRYALEHLWWIVSFQDEPGISEVLDRIGRMLHGLDNLKCTSDE